MKYVWKVMLFIIVFLLVLSSGIASRAIAPTYTIIPNQSSNKKESQLIPIEPDQIKDECIIQIADTFVRSASTLVDNQDALPTNPNQEFSKEALDNIDNATWYPASKPDIKKVSCYIDLKDTYRITHIAFKDVNGNPTVEFLQGSPFHWNSIVSHKMNSYLTWTSLPIETVETRYLQLVSDSNNAGISEIALYGYKVKEGEKGEIPSEEKPNFGITIDKAIGANGFIDDRMSEIKAVGHIREYHNYRWIIESKGQNKFNPSSGWPWDFDSYYQTLHENSIDIIPCIQGTSKFLLDPESVKKGDFTLNEKPLKYDLDPSKPESYTDHASTLFQYAARYGNTKVEEDKLQVASDQEKKTGLGYIQYYENNNEPDKSWETMKSYASPYELAAMCSADYDGHEGKMGDTYGIKNADPTSKLVLGGLAGARTEYLDLMKLWFENNRKDKKMAFDVINFHCYSGNQAPEESDFKEKCKTMVDWRNQNAPDKEIWLTEFGWDTNVNSKLAAPSAEVQGDWLVRGYLNSFAAGVDRTTMFMLRDPSYSSNPSTYSTSGLVTEKGAWTKKASWYYVSTLKNTLTGYTLDNVQENDNVYVYRFKKDGTNEVCYAIWSPTSNGSKIDDYVLPIGTDMTKATLTTLKDGYYDGIKSKLKIQNGTVCVPVSESPIFVTADDIQGKYLTPTIHKIEVTLPMITTQNEESLMTQTHLTEKDVLIQFSHLFDEQKSLPNAPEQRYTGNVSTKWGNLWPTTIFPLKGEIDLGKNYVITHVGFYDSTGTGSLQIYQGKPNEWEDSPSLEYGLNTYNSWVVKPVSMETQYLKLQKADNAECYEIAFYGYSIYELEEDPNYELNHPTDPETPNEPEEPTPPTEPEEPNNPDTNTVVPPIDNSTASNTTNTNTSENTTTENTTNGQNSSSGGGTVNQMASKNNTTTNIANIKENRLADRPIPKAGNSTFLTVLRCLTLFSLLVVTLAWIIRKQNKSNR